MEEYEDQFVKSIALCCRLSISEEAHNAEG